MASEFPSRPAQSLPATPSAANVRTFTDYSGEHTRLTTLHGSTGALEVNNLGGFKLGPTSLANGTKFANALESSIDGIVRTNTSVATANDFSSGMSRRNGTEHLGLGQGLIPKQTTANLGMTMVTSVSGNGMVGGMNHFHPGVVQGGHGIHHGPPGVGEGPGMSEVDDLADVFTGLNFKEPSIVAAPGYGRARPRRASAPVGANGEPGGFGAIGGAQNGYGLWGNGASENPLPEVSKVSGGDYHIPTSRNSPIQQQQHQQQYPTNGGSFSAGIGPHPSFNTAWANNNGGGGAPGAVAKGNNIWSQGSAANGNSRPNSQSSSCSNDSSIQSSPIYSPTSSSSFVGFGGPKSSASDNIPTSLGIGLLNIGMGHGAAEERVEVRSPFRVRMIL